MDTLLPRITPVLLSSCICCFIFIIWYGPVFGKVKREWSGTDDETTTYVSPVIIGVVFLLSAVMALTIDILLPLENMHATDGILVGLLLGLGLIATSFGVNYLFGRKSLVHFFIDTGYQIIVLVVVNVILTIWR